MRIVSLLPSLTELVCALGHRDDLVGVTHECDYPEGVAALPHLTRSRIPSAATGAEIDALVSAQGGSLYELDAGLLARLEPDLILTQEQCDVCAVNEATVRLVAAALPGAPPVESVNPTCMDDVHGMFLRVGSLLGAEARGRAEGLVRKFVETSAAIGLRRDRRPKPRTLLLEWLDPPFTSGHWNPEIIAAADGVEPLARPARSRGGLTGLRSRRPPRGGDRGALRVRPGSGRAEMEAVVDRSEWQGLPAVRDGRVVLADGSAYFSRPGPGSRPVCGSPRRRSTRRGADLAPEGRLAALAGQGMRGDSITDAAADRAREWDTCTRGD